MTKKKKLSKGQSRRIKANMRKRFENACHQESSVNPSSNTQHTEENLLPSETGIIISRFGQHADVEDIHGDVSRCDIRRTVTSLVCGDKVLWRRTKHTDSEIIGVIEAVEERSTVLTRPDYYDGIKPIAANIDQIIIVSAILPTLTPNIIDRYLVAAEDVGIPPILVINKIDLANEEQLKLVHQLKEQYESLGYPLHCVSTVSGEGMNELNAILNDKVSIFVGQSGVGKSSLTNQIMPELAIPVKDVSDVSGLGQHTTTVARLYHLPEGGKLIDSPGVREFSLWHLEPQRVTWGFKEFRELASACKFRDCKHLNDPGCAVREALEQGIIHQGRFDSYHKILESMEENRPGRGRTKAIRNKTDI